MADRVDITDPFQVDPSLRGKSKAQLKHERNLRDMAIAHMEREEKKAELEDEVREINEAQEAIVNGLKVLEKNKLIPEQIREAHSTAGGVFAPHLKYKAIDAERLLGHKQLIENPKQKQKRTRRKSADV